MVLKIVHLHEIWKQGWLKTKEYCGNPKHELYQPIIDDIVRDLNIGLNRSLLVVGMPRTGKTHFSIWYMCYMNWCYYGREEYKPSPDNIEPLKDLYWDLDDFIEATKNPKNNDKWIVMEEQGLAQYKNLFWREDVTNYDKLTQIFGVDMTNPILNLPFVFDIVKGTRLKANYLFRTYRPKKNQVDVKMFPRVLSETTEKAYFSKRDAVKWFDVPDIAKIYPRLIEEYEKLKKAFNLKKKGEFTSKGIKRDDNSPQQQPPVLKTKNKYN